MSGNLEALGDGGFDTSSVEPSSGSYDPIPAGWYTAEIEEAEVVDTKAGTGKRLKMTMSVLDEEYKGRKLFPSLNIQNPNPKAVEIALRELAAIGIACELSNIGDSSELVGKVLDVKVKIKKEEGYDASNDVSGYRKAGGVKAKKKAPAKKKAKAETEDEDSDEEESSGKRPWEKK